MLITGQTKLILDIEELADDFFKVLGLFLIYSGYIYGVDSALLDRQTFHGPGIMDMYSKIGGSAQWPCKVPLQLVQSHPFHLNDGKLLLLLFCLR